MLCGSDLDGSRKKVTTSESGSSFLRLRKAKEIGLHELVDPHISSAMQRVLLSQRCFDCQLEGVCVGRR